MVLNRDLLHRFNVLKVSRINSELVTKSLPLIPSSLIGTGRGFSVSGPLSSSSVGGLLEVSDVDNVTDSVVLFSYTVTDTPKVVEIRDEVMQLSYNHFFSVATEEAEAFNDCEYLDKISVKKGRVRFSKSRILDGQRFVLSGGMEDSVVLRGLDINIMTPVLDRYSLLAYSVADYVHTVISKHAGFETCCRSCLNFCHIIHSLSLFKELGDECVACAKKRKKFVQALMGPTPGTSFTLMPPFWICMGDLMGPFTVYVPGRERNTRRTNSLDSKVWVIAFICPTTKILNLQVMEGRSADSVCCALSRLGCEVGFPSHFLVDQDSALMKVLNEAEVTLVDLKYTVKKDVKVTFDTCPVSGHNYHGLVERKLRTVQEVMARHEFATSRLTATGLQSLIKLVESDLNSTPLGLSYDRSSSNTPLLKLISPMMMRIRRMTARNLQGPVTVPSGPADMMRKVSNLYEIWYQVYNDTYILKILMDMVPKWFKHI